MAFMKKMKDGFNKLVGTPLDAQVARSRPITRIIPSPSLHTQQARIMTELAHIGVIVHPCSYGERAVAGQHLVDELASLELCCLQHVDMQPC